VAWAGHAISLPGQRFNQPRWLSPRTLSESWHPPPPHHDAPQPPTPHAHIWPLEWSCVCSLSDAEGMLSSTTEQTRQGTGLQNCAG
jgi:hypothetical protein